MWRACNLEMLNFNLSALKLLQDTGRRYVITYVHMRRTRVGSNLGC